MGIGRRIRQFLISPAVGPSDDFEALGDWLATLPPGNPAARAHALAAQLRRMRDQDLALGSRLELLGLMHEQASVTLAAAEGALRLASLPLLPERLQVLAAGQELIEELGASYLAAVELAGRAG